MKINIVYGNHKYENNTYDIAHIAYIAFKKSGRFERITSSKYPIKNEINLIIEEFSDADFCEMLESMKVDFPLTKFVLILTEIPTDYSYNAFDKEDYEISKNIYEILKLNDYSKAKNTIQLLSIAFLKHLHPLFKIKRDYINYSKIKSNLLIKIINKLYKIIFLKKNPYFFKFLYYPSHLSYFVVRFINSKILIEKKIFDLVYIINDSSKNITNSSFGCNSKEFPYYVSFNPNYNKKDIFMFSGNVTKERQELFKIIEKNGLKVQINPHFNNLARDILSETTMFSIQISRYLSGNYSSPTRTINALQHGLIPMPFIKPLYSNMEKELTLPLLEDVLTTLCETPATERLRVIRSYYEKHSRLISNKIMEINAKSEINIRNDFL